MNSHECDCGFTTNGPIRKKLHEQRCKFNFTPPFPGILQLLRHTGYNLEYSILELTDNSISKKSKDIRVKLFSEKPTGPLTRITVSDDGSGMDYDTLLNAFIISQRHRDRDDDDIGKFNVGMKSAVMNMGNNISIISKVIDKPTVGIFCDIMMMETNNTYEPTFHSSDINSQPFPNCIETSNSDHFNNQQSGTLIQVDRLRSMYAINVKKAFETMKITLSHSYNMAVL